MATFQFLVYIFLIALAISFIGFVLSCIIIIVRGKKAYKYAVEHNYTNKKYKNFFKEDFLPNYKKREMV